MKFRVKNTNETLPVVKDSLICGLRPDGNEVEFSIKDVELIPDEWSAFRREVAKDILCAMLGRVERLYTGVSMDGKKISDHKDFIKLAIEDADELIKQLKENEKS